MSTKELAAHVHRHEATLQKTSARQLALDPATNTTMRSVFVVSDPDPITRFLRAYESVCGACGGWLCRQLYFQLDAARAGVACDDAVNANRRVNELATVLLAATDNQARSLVPQFRPQAYLCAWSDAPIQTQYTDVLHYTAQGFPSKVAQLIEAAGLGWANKKWTGVASGRLYPADSGERSALLARPHEHPSLYLVPDMARLVRRFYAVDYRIIYGAGAGPVRGTGLGAVVA